jgi:hypothetical protein
MPRASPRIGHNPVMRALSAWFTVGLVLTAPACGDDSGGGAPDAAVTDASPDAMHPDISGLYASPMDFDRIGCTAGSLAGFDPVAPAGIWHYDFHDAGFGPFPGLIKFSRPGGALSAWMNLGVTSGMDTPVTLDANDLFVRQFYTNASGLQRVRTVDICNVNPDGTVDGKWALCNQEWDGACYSEALHGVRVQRIPGEGESQGLTKISEFAGAPAAPWPVSGLEIGANVRVLDGVAYLARYGDGLRVVDVSNPAQPADLGWAPVAQPDRNEIYNDVKLAQAGGKTYAFMASSRRGIVVLDVTDPAAIVEKATFPELPSGQDHISVHTIYLEPAGNQLRAYIANLYTAGLDVWDVTDPTHPSFLGAYVNEDAGGAPVGFVHDLYVENGRAYLCYWDAGLIVVDTLADPAHPTVVGRFDSYDRRTTHSTWVTTTSGGRKVALVGDEDYGAHLHVVDVQDGSPTFMQSIGELQLRPEVSIHNIMAFGDTGYIVWYQDGARLIDVSDPTQPKLAGYYNTWTGPGEGFYEGAIGLDVDLAQKLMYVVDEDRGLFVLKLP